MCPVLHQISKGFQVADAELSSTSIRVTADENLVGSHSWTTPSCCTYPYRNCSNGSLDIGKSPYIYEVVKGMNLRASNDASSTTYANRLHTTELRLLGKEPMLGYQEQSQAYGEPAGCLLRVRRHAD